MARLFAVVLAALCVFLAVKLHTANETIDALRTDARDDAPAPHEDPKPLVDKLPSTLRGYEDVRLMLSLSERQAPRVEKIFIDIERRFRELRRTPDTAGQTWAAVDEVSMRNWYAAIEQDVEQDDDEFSKASLAFAAQKIPGTNETYGKRAHKLRYEGMRRITKELGKRQRAVWLKSHAISAFVFHER